MTILTMDRCVLVTVVDTDVISSVDRTGKVTLARDDGLFVLGEYPSNFMARAVVSDIYNAIGSQVKYRMPTIGEAKRLDGIVL